MGLEDAVVAAGQLRRRRARDASVETIVAVGVGVALVSVAAQSLLYLVGHFVIGTRLLHQHAATYFATYGGALAVALAFVGAVALALAGERRAMTLAPILAFFAVDEAFEVHEAIGRGVVSVIGAASPDTVWPVLYAPLLAFAAVLILRSIGGGPPVARRLGGLGLAALGLALVAQVVWVLVRGEGYHGSDRHLVELSVEEGLELLGWLVIATALAAAARWRRERHATA
jgi:hypothetical protein